MLAVHWALTLLLGPVLGAGLPGLADDASAPTPPPSQVPSSTPPQALEDEAPLPPLENKSKGMGFVMAFGLVANPASSHQWQTICPSVTTNYGAFTPTCSTTIPVGFFTEGRFNVMFGALGLDFFGMLAGDLSTAQLNGPQPIPLPAYATSMLVGRLGIAGGAGLRFKTPKAPVRVSGGVGGGAMYRRIFSNVSSLGGGSEEYAAPIIRADVGFILVNLFTFGVAGWVEFAPRVTVTPDLSILGPEAASFESALGTVVVADGPQAFLGVFGGLSLGK